MIEHKMFLLRVGLAANTALSLILLTYTLKQSRQSQIFNKEFATRIDTIDHQCDSFRDHYAELSTRIRKLETRLDRRSPMSPP